MITKKYMLMFFAKLSAVKNASLSEGGGTKCQK